MGGPPPIGAGGPPMGPPPMGMRARGGKVSYPIHSGGGGGEARLEKAKSYPKLKEGQALKPEHTHQREGKAFTGNGENKPMRARGGAKC